MYLILRKMIASGWAWASKTNNLRKSPVHGEEEAKLVLNDKFECADVTEQHMELQGSFELEDCMAPLQPQQVPQP